MISLKPSKILDQIYAAGLTTSKDAKISTDPQSLTGEDIKETASEIMFQFSNKTSEIEPLADVLLLNKKSGVAIAGAFETKEMAVEIERAVEQVTKSLTKPS
jgi:hypothetical protein